MASTDQPKEFENRSDEKYNPYIRVRSAPPQETPASVPVFQLCNMDGTPLIVDQPQSESLMSEEVEQILNQDESPEQNKKEKEINLNENIESEVQKNETEKLVVETCLSNHDESSNVDLDSNSEFMSTSEFKQFMEVEKLIIQFPPLGINDIKLKIESLLSVTEREPVLINFVFPKSENTMADRLKALKEKEDTPIQRVRNEFNRVTEGNRQEVIKILKQVRVSTISEMQEIAGFVLEKAISEELYLETYSFIIGELKREWRCEEEKALKERKQTCFFGTLLRFLLTRLKAKQTWATELDISSVKSTDRADLERKIEDYETDRLKRKKMALGSIGFIVSLYITNVIGPSNVIAVCDSLRSVDSAENVEMACKLLESVCAKFSENGKSGIIEDLYNYLSRNLRNHGIRMEYVIESAMKKASHYVRQRGKGFGDSKVSSEPKNTYAEMINDESEGEEEKIREYVYSVTRRIQGVIKEVFAGEGFTGGDLQSEKILRESDEYGELIKDIKAYLKSKGKESNRLFFTAYIMELVTNPKAIEGLRIMLISDLVKEASDFIGSIQEVKSEYAMLRIDFPKAPRYFSELLGFLRGAEILNSEELERFKPQGFPQLASDLMRRWKSGADSRLSKVFSVEDQKVLQ